MSSPGQKKTATGSLHPVTAVTDDVVDIFSRLGFAVAEGPKLNTIFTILKL